MAKPMGPICNLNCDYCFYLEKKSLFPALEQFRMSDQVLETYIKIYMQQDIPEISFVWQGGEPMLAGIEFYEKAWELQQMYANGRKVTNALQTNGTLLNDEWCQFLKSHNFSVGLSLDGPEKVHNRHRKNQCGKGAFAQVMEGLRLLQKYQIDYNVLACVTGDEKEDPLEIYHFFKRQGVKCIQFTPVVERKPDEDSEKLRLCHAMPGKEDTSTELMEWSVKPAQYGDFLIRIFDEWVKKDVGDIFVMNFEWALTSWLGLENTMCVFTKQCGGCGIIEHDGDIYSCDHYMYPQYRLGNILESHPAVLMTSERQKQFGEMKEKGLPEKCRKCEVLFACRGECPRHRFGVSGQEDGVSYLCEGYKNFFWHIHPYMKAMVQLIENDLPASRIMTLREEPVVIVK